MLEPSGSLTGSDANTGYDTTPPLRPSIISKISLIFSPFFLTLPFESMRFILAASISDLSSDKSSSATHDLCSNSLRTTFLKKTLWKFFELTFTPIMSSLIFSDNFLILKAKIKMVTYSEICMNLETILVSTSLIWLLHLLSWSKMNFSTSFRDPNLSTSAWKISSKLNGHSILDPIVADLFDWIVIVCY